MDDKHNLNRFIQAQTSSYKSALQELRNGKKTSHWMWYIFPQLKGLGRSYNSTYYGLSGTDEAQAYLNHPVLNARLREVCEVILGLETSDAQSVFGWIDSQKLRSSMTLFDAVSPNDIFAAVLDKYYGGKKDHRTIASLKIITGSKDNKSMNTKITTETKTTVKVDVNTEETQSMGKVAPKGYGNLDMVIAFDTTGSMAAYIEDVRYQVADMIPRLFKDNENLRLGIVAFGDYCDMENAGDFGDAYQCMPLTDNENDIIRFVRESKDTGGGDGDEFYELVLKKIIDESPWREDSSKAILLIADADPHELGYTYRDYVVGNQISWKAEAQKAADMKIKIDTVSIAGRPWYKELSAMTNGISVPFRSSGKTGTMIETATTARSAMAFAESANMSEDAEVRRYNKSRVHGLRGKLSGMFSACEDKELKDVYDSYSKEIDKTEEEQESDTWS